MISNFAHSSLENFFFNDIVPKKVGWSNVANVVKRKLNMLNAAKFLGDLKSPPKNRLEALSGSYKGFYSIRANDQWRIVFKWSDSNGASEVDVVDYH
jgi:proteic killer suppression protein